MSTVLTLTRRVARELPARFRDDDVRYSESLVEHCLDAYTEPGEYVLDPFAGWRRWIFRRSTSP